jgi:hypothetical protein
MNKPDSKGWVVGEAVVLEGPGVSCGVVFNIALEGAGLFFAPAACTPGCTPGPVFMFEFLLSQ